MKMYTLTVFSKSGEKLLDESFNAATDDEAKRIGEERLSNEGYQNYTHRCVTPDANLLLFHR
ncbi:YhzD family protein [Virgibacillus sp. W0430]|uniref:YhzD family protein n=1 Tax=Virgibacillus sp. W0430 TaxID=3391580 RepID=UPI003F476700